MASYLLQNDGVSKFLLNAGGAILLNGVPPPPPPDTGGGGVLLDLGKRKRYAPKGLSHVELSEVGGETLMAAGTRAKADSLRALIEQKQRTADDEMALVFILSELL